METIKSTFALLTNSKGVKETLLSYSYLGLIIILLFSLESCDSDDEVTKPVKPDVIEIFSGEQLNESILDNRKEAIQLFTISGENGGTIHGKKGTILTFFS